MMNLKTTKSETENGTMYYVNFSTDDEIFFHNVRNNAKECMERKPMPKERYKLCTLIENAFPHMDIDKSEYLAEYLIKNGIRVPGAWRSYPQHKAYCLATPSCDKCNKRIRFWCRVKNFISGIQSKIIEKRGLL